MSYKTITIPANAVDPVMVTVEMPQFEETNKIMVNYQIWLIYDNVKQNIRHGTNTDNIPDIFPIQMQAQVLKGKMLRVDYTLINGSNVDVSFYTSIDSNNTIDDTLTETISISSFMFQ